MKINRWGAHVSPGTLKQMSAIVAMGCILGLAYNASNPIGIRWSEMARPSSPTNSAAHSNDPSRVQTRATHAMVPPALATAGESRATAPAQAKGYVAPTPAFWAEIKPLHAQGRVVLVDARARPFFDAGHIPGAVNLPEPPDAEEWAAFRKQYPTNAHVVVYCGSTTCSLSFKLANRLAKESGYEFVQYITGGYQTWLREETLGDAGGIMATGRANLATGPLPGIAVQDLPPILPPVAAHPTGQKIENALPISWAQTRPMLAIRQAVLLDARSKAEYDLGHIAGALSLPADSPPETIRKVLADRNSSTRLITYCGAM